MHWAFLRYFWVRSAIVEFHWFDFRSIEYDHSVFLQYAVRAMSEGNSAANCCHHDAISIFLTNYIVTFMPEMSVLYKYFLEDFHMDLLPFTMFFNVLLKDTPKFECQSECTFFFTEIHEKSY